MGKRDVQEVNAGSMADIAFLLLIFFLVTTTMDTDSGLSRMLPPPVPEDQETPPPIKDRNVFEVLINSQNRLLVENEPMELRELRDAAKEFIQNPLDEEGLPEKEEKQIEYFGIYPVSKGVISLQNDRGTQYQMYLSVQNELAAAYNELRNELSQSKFGKKFDELEEDKQDAIRDIYPQKISEAEPKNIGGK
ncbi:biopolymer transporter ExbD [Marinilabilia salmonicolor]|jgi:biopolymer transport protein ExbD|uniref:Biopolymer transport protein ExbD n=1 Tax=Marinilabilia salmonicolor TaxID=989 RepID=A0A2T0XDM0_9BACT|nr:biopolymer transporter ExbD [Marinilabilia salmonicolor]PRY97026.1 biopolymer transport protein ExbD [Marinilabilia salmonicolor]RCW32691.1 biopolymer transport protein ExbD [Marinilabilia salmonicolor]